MCELLNSKWFVKIINLEMMKTKLFLSILASLVFLTAKAQNGWSWGDQPQKAKEQYTIFSDAVGAKSYKSALEPLNWLLENTPDLHKALYQKAQKLYNGLVREEKDANLKTEYQDKALEMYDLRIKYFKEEASVLNQKGYYALAYWQQKPEKYGDLYDLYGKIIELNKNETFSLNIKNYMYLVGIMKKNKLKGVDELKVIDIYENLTGIVQHNIANAKDDKAKKDWEETQEYIDKQFTAIVTLTCEIIKDKMLPKLKEVEGEEKIKLMNNLLGNMLKAKCTKEPEFIQLSEELLKLEPTYGRYQFIIKYYIGEKNYQKAFGLIKESLKYTDKNSDKADAYMTMAKIKQTQKNYSGARSDAYSAVQLDASKAFKAYTMVGNLYMSSGGMCKGSVAGNPCHIKAVYIAAYNMYQKAGNSAKMAQARQYFPTKEEIFTHSMGGQAVNVGCWIGETVTIPSL